MKRVKKGFFVLAAVLVLSLPVGVYAATSDSNVAANLRGFCGLGINSANLTEEQKQDLDNSFNQMMEVKKESINKMVQDGLLTEEQGTQELERLDNVAKYHEENGYGAGMLNGSCNGTTDCTGNSVGTRNSAQHGCGMMGRHY